MQLKNESINPFTLLFNMNSLHNSINPHTQWFWNSIQLHMKDIHDIYLYFTSIFIFTVHCTFYFAFLDKPIWFINWKFGILSIAIIYDLRYDINALDWPYTTSYISVLSLHQFQEFCDDKHHFPIVTEHTC